MAWSIDNRIVFLRERQLWTFSLTDRRAELMPEQPGGDAAGTQNLSLSHGSEWAAFASVGGQPRGFRVFMRQFPGGTNYQVSRELGNAPVWSRDGRELFYFQTESRTLVSVRIQPPPAFSVTEPTIVPIKSLFQSEGEPRKFDIMPDNSFLILQPAVQEGGAGPRATQEIHVVLNWLDELPGIAPRR